MELRQRVRGRYAHDLYRRQWAADASSAADERLVSVGGVMVPERAVAGFAAELDGIRAELEIPEGEEIKWNPPKRTFQASAGGELINELRQRMLRAAIDQGIQSAVAVWDRGHLPWGKADIEPEILKYLYERITLHLREHDDVGVIIADQPGGGRKDEMKWLADSLDLTREGTRFATPERVVSPILTAPSHHVPHLQLADLVTAGTTAAIAGQPSGMKLGVARLQGESRKVVDQAAVVFAALYRFERLLIIECWTVRDGGNDGVRGPLAQGLRRPGRPSPDQGSSRLAG